MDVDTRLLRAFTAVAAEGTLTRAAERLFVSQPALTKQIRRLERELGVELFSRSREGMTLTAAGRALAEKAPALVDGWDRTQREVRAAAGAVLRVGFLAGAANEATPAIIAAFGRRRPDRRVEMHAAAWDDPTAGLSTRDCDVALLRLPFPGQEGFRVDVLFAEPRVVALAAGHPLAARDSIPFRELWDEPFVAAPAGTGAWRDWWLATDRREGHPVRVGAVTAQPDDWLTAIAHGDGVALAPASAARYYARPGVVYRPVPDLEPSRVGVARPDGSDAAVEDFVRCCVRCCIEGTGS